MHPYFCASRILSNSGTAQEGTDKLPYYVHQDGLSVYRVLQPSRTHHSSVSSILFFGLSVALAACLGRTVRPSCYTEDTWSIVMIQCILSKTCFHSRKSFEASEVSADILDTHVGLLLEMDPQMCMG